VYALALILVEAVTGTVPFAARSTVATLSARVGRLMPVSADLGPLASVLERAGRPDPADRSSASELGRSLVRAAEKLPRPAPIPILAPSRLGEDPSQLRRPNDPTGGLHRPQDEPAPALVPPVAAPPGLEPEPEPAATQEPEATQELAPEPEVVPEAQPEPEAHEPEPELEPEVVADVPLVTADDVAEAEAQARATDPVEPTVEDAPEERPGGSGRGRGGGATVTRSAGRPGRWCRPWPRDPACGDFRTRPPGPCSRRPRTSGG
jgi:hypothetical protein